MTGNVVDLNDRKQAGTLARDPREGAEPLNAKAREAQEREPPRVLTVKQLLEEAAARAVKPGGMLKNACTTGHYRLDEITGGFVPGFVWVFGADTSWGKTSFFVAAADENIKRGKRVLIVSAEDPPGLYADRLLARRARVDADGLRKGRLTSDEKQAIARVRDEAEDVPVYVHCEGRPIERLAKELRVIVKLEGVDMVVFDYLQEFRSSGKHQDERTRFKHTSSVMRELIRGENKSGAILSQLTINSDTKIPNKHNIRESRDVSNAAEVICLGFTPDADVYGPNSDGEPTYRGGHRYILVDKNKNGPARQNVEMSWDNKSACFDSVVDPEQERLEREAARYAHLTDDFDDGFGAP